MPIRNFDSYYDPPEESEEILCEDCNQPLESKYQVTGEDDLICINIFCPSKFSSTAKEMAEFIVELRDEVETLKSKKKYLERKIERLEFYRDEEKK